MPSRRARANAIRASSMDAVQKANCGHPGMPMSMADIAEVLWNDFHKHDPANPSWIDRDHFVLSNSHGAMLLYSLVTSQVTTYPWVKSSASASSSQIIISFSVTTTCSRLAIDFISASQESKYGS